LASPNKQNIFAYQECVNRRILLWNEPNYSAEETDNLKMLLGGDNFTCRVKYKNDVSVQRTPVIVLSNEWVAFMKDETYDHRIVVYSWQYAPMLKEYSSKPHPLVLLELYEKYGIL
jgi:phage/plasmid-associated DNA primase